MTGTGNAAKIFRHLFDLDIRLVAGGIHVLIGGEKDHIDTDAFSHPGIPLKIAGIFRKIFFGTELCGIDVNADDDLVGQAAGFFHQREMTFVKVAHGGNKRNPFPGKPYAFRV